MTLRLTSALVVVVAVGLAAPVTHGAGQDPFGQGAYRPGRDIENPRLVKGVDPQYTPEAMRAKIAGTVELDAVVLVNGAVGEVQVVKSLDKQFGLDEAAIRAAKGWLFAPGRRAGQPVPVIVRLILDFRIRARDGNVIQQATPPAQVSDEEFLKGAHLADAPGVVRPELLRRVQPRYTIDAMRAKIQGTVEVEAVVMSDGTIGRARVAKSLDPLLGLDAQALAAVVQWTFTPGTLYGQPVPVVVRVTVEFRIH
jgi:protein TonB